MNLQIDGKDIPGGSTLASALDAGREHALARGRIVIDVRADGRPVESGDLAAPSTLAGEFAEVIMLTADPVQLVSVSLADGADALERSRDVQREAAESIQAGHLQKGMEDLQQVLKTWQGVQDLLQQSTALLGLDLSTLVVPGVHGEIPVGGAIERLTVNLRVVQDSLVRSDVSALADVLTFDLDALSAVWSQMLRGLADQIARSGAGGGDQRERSDALGGPA